MSFGRVGAFAAFLAFLIGGIIEAVNADDLGHDPWFWLLAGLAGWALAGAEAVNLTRR